MSPENIGVIVERLEAIDTRLVSIEKQVKETNGRVTSLEKWQARLSGLAGGAFAVGLVADLGHRLGLF